MKVCFCVGVCVLFMSAFMSPCETHVKSFFQWKEKKTWMKRVSTRDDDLGTPHSLASIPAEMDGLLYRLGSNQRTYAHGRRHTPPPSTTTSSGISSKKVKTMWQS